MSVDLNAELAALRQLVLNSKDDLARYRSAHFDDCFSTAIRSEFFEFVAARKVFDVDFFTDVHFSAVFSPDVPHDLLFTD